MMSIKQDRGAKTTQQQDKQAFATFDDQPKLGKGGYLKPVCKVSYSTTLFLLGWMHRQYKVHINRHCVWLSLDFVQEGSLSAA